jgi:hypothetical protein
VDFSMALIEFGERTSFQDPSQLHEAERLISSKNKVLLVTYVHGWHNYSGSRDMERFRGFLNELTGHRTVKGSRFSVVGVYLGSRRKFERAVHPLGVKSLDELLVYW